MSAMGRQDTVKKQQQMQEQQRLLQKQQQLAAEQISLLDAAQRQQLQTMGDSNGDTKASLSQYQVPFGNSRKRKETDMDYEDDNGYYNENGAFVSTSSILRNGTSSNPAGEDAQQHQMLLQQQQLQQQQQQIYNAKRYKPGHWVPNSFSQHGPQYQFPGGSEHANAPSGQGEHGTLAVAAPAAHSTSGSANDLSQGTSPTGQIPNTIYDIRTDTNRDTPTSSKEDISTAELSSVADDETDTYNANGGLSVTLNTSNDSHGKLQPPGLPVGFGPSVAFASSTSGYNEQLQQELERNMMSTAGYGFGSGSSAVQASNELLNPTNNAAEHQSTNEPTNFSGAFRERGLSIPGTIDGHSFDHFIRMLDVMSKEDLISLMVELMKTNETVQYSIARAIPRPTVEVVERLLMRSEKDLLTSIPYKKSCPDRSAYAFNRVRSKIVELKDRIYYYLDVFVKPTSYSADMKYEYPENAINYLDFVTDSVHRFPTWDDEQQTHFCSVEVYERLGSAWQVAIVELNRLNREEGKMFDKYTVTSWAKALDKHCVQLDGRYGFAEALNLFKQTLGWIIGC